MKKILLPLLAIVALLLMIAWMAGLFVEKIEPGMAASEQTVRGDPVTVEASVVTIIEKVPASVEAAQATLISSRLLARIVAVRVRAGDSVSRGDLLLELENSDIRAQVQQAEAIIGANTARLNEARQNLGRVKELQAGGVMSVADLDKAQAIHDALLADLAGARQALQVEIPSMQKVVDAVIEERVPAADPGSRSFKVKASFAFDKSLLPGMYARLLVPVGNGTQLLIPADRVVHVGQLDLVWVYEDGQSYRRFVRIGSVDQNGQVEILAGLKEGEWVLPLP